ncbi:MAG: ATPase with chaperone activity [Burkholderiaceae bacterium]
MSDANQSDIPRSFIDLFIKPGSVKPSEPRQVIAQRYELCEDMAQMLVGAAKDTLFELGVAEEDVLTRMHRGLLVDGSVVAPDEAGWVIRRLAELLDWPALECSERS